METIHGYELFEKIVDTRGFSIYSGRKEGGTTPVVIKILKAREPSSTEIARFEQEHGLIKAIDHDGIIQPIDFVCYNGTFALVQEWFDGISLDKLLKRIDRFDLTSFLRIAINLVETLGYLHQKDIIHAGLKPSHIFIRQDTGQVKITGFGIAALLTHENDDLYDPDVISTYLAYISPEQTGRTNRAMDYRTDLYSLGVTFYEMLTGTVPFISSDPMEIIHSHIAANPVPPGKKRSDIPSVVSDIVLKLLSKTAEDRYQNAYGLLVDLKACLKQFEENGAIDVFPLARRDISKHFIIPKTLFGRKKELDLLISAFDRISLGSTEMLLVTGNAGRGKTALINEIQRSIVERRGYFISGKYESVRQNVPYRAIIQAFQGLVRQMLAESREKIEIWKKKFCEALGDNAKVIIDVIPDMSLIIGEQQALAELGPQESQKRFDFAFKNFIKVFASQAHPLVLFLDNLQLIDVDSLRLVRNIINDPDMHFLLLVGAYRDTEVNDMHPLKITLDKIRKRHKGVHTVPLPPLTVEDVNQLLSTLLKCHAELSMPLAEVVFQKTNGNPFFINQFLKNLHDHHMLELDGAVGWKWDVDKIKRIRVTDNVVDLMAETISALPDKTRQLLKIGSCLGNGFDLEALSFLSDTPIQETLAELNIALQKDLITRDGETYKFHHGRVLEACYSILSEKEKSVLHHKIGKRLLSQLSGEELQERIFYVVNQLNLGMSQFVDQSEKDDLIQLNLLAAQKAKGSVAFAEVSKYMVTAKELLAEDSWQTNYQTTLSVYMDLANSEHLNHRFDEATHLLETALYHSNSTQDRARVYTSKMLMLASLAKHDKAVEAGLLALKLMGIRLAKRPNRLIVLKELYRMRIKLKRRDFDSIRNLPEMTDPDRLLIMNILMNIYFTAFFYDPNIVSLLVLKMIDLTLKYGSSKVSAFAYLQCGAVFAVRLGDYQMAFKLGRLGIKLNDRFKHVELIPKIQLVFGASIGLWRMPIRKVIPELNKGLEVAFQTWDHTTAVYTIQMILAEMLAAGYPLNEILQVIEKHMSFVENAGDVGALNYLISVKQGIKCLKGETVDAFSLDDDQFEEKYHIEKMVNIRIPIVLHRHYVIKMRLLFVMGDFDEALKMARISEKMLAYSSSMIPIAEHYFYYALILAALYPAASMQDRRGYLKELKKSRRMIKIWANNCPENFLHKYHLITAEAFKITGRYKKAMDFYHCSVQSARENEYIQCEAIACERFALAGLENGYDDIGRTYLIKARDGYLNWGAATKAKALEEQYPQIFSEKADTFDSIDNRKTDIDADEQDAKPMHSDRKIAATLDFNSIIKASITLSGEIVLGRLLKKLMRICIENAGAQKAFFILNTHGRLFIEAEGTIDQEEVQVLQSVPLESHTKLSPAVVQYVERTKEALILNDASRLGDFINDSYVRKHRSKSILCFPIIHQGRLTGILYLENDLITGAFTTDRLEVLNIISSQVAISLENAMLYEAGKRAEEKMKNLLETANEGFWEIDRKGYTVNVNQELCRIIGRPREQIVGRHILSFSNQDSNPIVRKQTEHLKRWEKSTYELKITRRDNTIVYCQINMSPIIKNDELIGSFAMITDITRIKEVEAQIRQLNADLEQRVLERTRELNEALKEIEKATQAKSEFLANMSHEIRTPLNGVMGVLNLLQMTRLDSEQLDLVATGKKSADGLLTVINDILDFSKIEAGELVIETLDFDLYNTIRDFVEIPAMLAHEKNLEFTYEIEHKVPSRVKGDPGRLRQILLNLTSNATKFTKDGEIAVRISMEHETETHAKIKFEVSDSGIGIPEDKIEAIFDAFKQTDSSTTREFGGTGLGLSISKKLSELMGGEIGVNSILGKGSIFWFSILFEKQLNVKEDINESFENIGGKRVLLVDDNGTNLNILSRYIESWDCSCDTADSGEMALSLLNAVAKVNAPFDAIIIDGRMPGMDGAQLGKEIRADNRFAGIPMIMLVSHGLRGDAAKMKQIGFTAYLTKPIGKSQLFDCLVAVMNKEQSAHKESRIITKHAIFDKRRMKARILIVEDNSINQKMALKMIENFGFQGDIAANGHEALKALEQFKYDVVFMDVQMPVMDGFEAAKRIRDCQSKVLNRDIPLIAMTAHAMKGDKELCLEAGMDDYISKPIDPQEMLKAIERQLISKK